MKAIICNGFGAPSVMQWTEAAMPELATDEVLIKVTAAGVSRPDVLQRMGAYAPPTDASPILGLEVAGEVVAGSGFKVGDQVCALVHGGGYAQYVKAKSAHCLPIPQGWSFVEAAGLPETFFTVWFNVFHKSALGKRGAEVLLVPAGASGVGLTAIQMARAMGQTVYATASTPEKRQACLDYGAHHVFDSNNTDWAAQITEKGGVDVVLDMLAGNVTELYLQILKPKGRLVWIAFLAGQLTSVNVASVMAKEIQITGSFLRRQPNETKAQIARELLQNIWPHLNNRNILPMIDSIYPIQKVALAHERIQDKLNIGKIILQLDAC